VKCRDFEPLVVVLDDSVSLNRYVFKSYHISYYFICW